MTYEEYRASDLIEYLELSLEELDEPQQIAILRQIVKRLNQRIGGDE